MLNANDLKLIKFVQEMFAGIGSTPKVNWGIGYINFCASTCSDVFLSAVTSRTVLSA